MNDTLSERILDYLINNPNKWLTAKNIAEALLDIQNNVTVNLSRLERKLPSIERITTKRPFKYRYTPPPVISNEISLDRTWSGVTSPMELLNNELDPELNKYIAYIKQFFDPDKPLQVHGIKIYGDFIFDDPNRRIGHPDFEWNNRLVTVTLRNGSVEIGLSTSDNPLKNFEILRFLEMLEYQVIMGYWSNPKKRGINTGTMSNLGIIAIEYNQDSEEYSIETPYLELKILNEAWGTLEIAAYQKRTVIGKIFRKESKWKFKNQFRIPFVDVQESLFRAGNSVYQNYSTQKQSDKALQKMTEMTELVSQMTASVTTALENITDVGKTSDDFKELAKGLSVVSIQNARLLRNNVEKSSEIQAGVEQLPSELEEAILKNFPQSDSPIIYDTVGGIMNPAILNNELKLIYDTLIDPLTYRELSEKLNKDYKYIWNRIRALIDKGFVIKIDTKPITLVRNDFNV